MASSKDIYESGIYAAGMYAAGIFRGLGATVVGAVGQMAGIKLTAYEHRSQARNLYESQTLADHIYEHDAAHPGVLE
jgi:hypothetical protein